MQKKILHLNNSNSQAGMYSEKKRRILNTEHLLQFHLDRWQQNLQPTIFSFIIFLNEFLRSQSFT